MAETSTLAGEVEQFARLADDWWNPDGASAILPKLKPSGSPTFATDQPALGARRARSPIGSKSALDSAAARAACRTPGQAGAEVSHRSRRPSSSSSREHAAGQGWRSLFAPRRSRPRAASTCHRRWCDRSWRHPRPSSRLASACARWAADHLTPNATGPFEALTITCRRIGAIPWATHDF